MHSLFQRADTVEAARPAVQGLPDCWARDAAKDFPNYAAGSADPEAADRLAGAPWARMAGDQVWLRTYGDPLLTWLHQPSEVAL
jgi:hypothetical protein